ncbi:MAG TPA: signal peptidase I [Clostridiales bacterium]|nr:signal peptidase I [Clostridiales bacterium]
MAFLKKAGRILLEWVEILAVSFILAVVINLFVIQPVKVEGSSMMPTLQDNDFVILSRISKTLNLDLKYGDIVVIDRRTDRKRSILDDIGDLGFFSRVDNRNLLIKRVIGLPGDTIEIRDGGVYRNGERLDEPYLMEDTMYGREETYTVPEGHVFVLGDNRNNSMDSRVIGPIPMDNIKGTMVLDISKLLRSLP